MGSGVVLCIQVCGTHPFSWHLIHPLPNPLLFVIAYVAAGIFFPSLVMPLVEQVMSSSSSSCGINACLLLCCLVGEQRPLTSHDCPLVVGCSVANDGSIGGMSILVSLYTISFATNKN